MKNLKTFTKKGSHLKWWVDPRESWFPLTFLITTLLFWLVSQNLHQAVAVSLTLIVFCFNLFSYGYWYIKEEMIPMTEFRKIKNFFMPFIMATLFFMLAVTNTAEGQSKIFFSFFIIIPIGIVPFFIFWMGTGYWGLKITITIQMVILILTIVWDPQIMQAKIHILEQGIIGNEDMAFGLSNLLLKLNASLLGLFYSVGKAMLVAKPLLWLGIGFVVFNRTAYRFAREMDSFSWEPDE